MNFRDYVLFESDLEDLYVSDDATENIELIHEMEWKLGQIIENQYRLNPKMYVNLIKRFSSLAFDSYEDLSEKFDRLFRYWLEKHQIKDSHEWAKMVYQENEDSIEHNGYAGMGGVSMTADDVLENLDDEKLQSILEYEWGSMDQAFPEDHHHFLSGQQIVPPVTPEELEDYAEPWDYWEDNNDEAADYISNNNLENEYAQYCIEMLRDSGVEHLSLELDADAWINAIENKMYPEYYGMHGYNIEAVTPEVEEAIERFELTDELMKDAEKIRSNLHPDDADLDKNVERIKKIVGHATTAISLAMGVVHTSGNIMQDYGDVAELDGVDSDFLDGFHEREIDDWRSELKKIIR
jgi:hypothetical protein